MTNHETQRAQEAVMTEAQPITEKPARKNRSKKPQDATPAEPVDFKKLAQETREKMTGKKNPPSSEAAAESAQVEQPATHMPAHARFQLGQVVGVKATELVTPADQPGWIFPRGQHLAHWWNGEKAMCGREVADGTNIEANSDPSAYADRTCRKCRAALNKQPPVQAAPEPAETPAVSDIPAVINDIPEALTVATPVHGVAAPIHTIAQPVLEVAQPEFSVEQPQDSIQAPIPSELPGTPVLLSPANVKPGTLGVVNAQLSICVKSPCNVRMHYDDTKVQEIAASIKADGQLQECVGRWNSDGMLEIVAGETRRRAQVYRQEQGETDLTLRVHVRDLTDAQALRISAQENMARKDMTPLEECEAMLRMQEAGDTIENIQATFGYKSAQPVADRILVAKNLHSKARDALDNRELSLAQAMVIARAPGDDLQKNMLTSATGYNPASAQRLAEMLTRGQFLVEHAKFDVEAAGLEVKRDLFDAFTPYFESKPKALEAQLAWAERRAEQLRKKGKHAFVDVVLTSDSHHSLTFGHSKYEREYDKKGQGRGLVLHIHEYSGEYTEVSDIKLKAAKTITTTKADGTTTTESVREMPVSAYEEAHVLRARALRHSLLGQTRTTLVLTVHALIANYPYHGKAAIDDTPAWQAQISTPEIEEKLQHWQAAMSAALGVAPSLAYLSGEVYYRDQDAFNLKLYGHLSTLEEADLLDLLNVLVAARIYEPVVNYPKNPPAPLFRQLAQEMDSNSYLASTFKLTDEWLKRYPRHELVALAEEAGLGRALVEDCKTLKDMRGRILEHAEQLYKEGFVPKFVQFTGVEDSESDSDRRYRADALALIERMNENQINSLLEEFGHDPTDESHAGDTRSGKDLLLDELRACPISDLRDWDTLTDIAKSLGPATTDSAAD